MNWPANEKITFHRCISHRRVVQDFHPPRRFEDTSEGISEAFALVVHGLLDELVALVQLSEHHSSGREDGHPKDVGLAE